MVLGVIGTDLDLFHLLSCHLLMSVLLGFPSKITHLYQGLGQGQGCLYSREAVCLKRQFLTLSKPIWLNIYLYSNLATS